MAMGTDSADIWAWVHDDEERLEQEGGAKATIVDEYNAFWRYFHDDFAAADMAVTRALEAARATGELRWELHLRHWRLQLWLRDDLNRALPEAVDLLTLATDERVRDVPQRICAFHDVVDCYVEMDPAGYYDEIVANSQDILAQLPQRHPCATCARMHLAEAAAASGRVEEAETWVARGESLAYDRYAGWMLSVANTYETLGKWADAERYYRSALDQSRKNQEGNHYLKALLGIALARLGQGDVPGAANVLREARHTAKYTGETYLLARMLFVEGSVAEAAGMPDNAYDYLTRAARHFYRLGYHRLAAMTSMQAVDIARAAGLDDREDTLTLAARAVGMTPPASRDVRERLAALGREPVAPERAPGDVEMASAVDEDRQQKGEMAALEDALQGYIAAGNARGVSMALYRLGRWHDHHDQKRAAVDYLILNAVLERLLKLSMNDREDALNDLTHLRDTLPAGTVDAALAATESGPPSWLAPLLGEFPPDRWRWCVRSVAEEVAGKPAVEPPPRDPQGDFDDWLQHSASMTALVVRFRDQADPAQCERWAATMDEVASEIEAGVPSDDEQRRAILSLVRGLATISRGASPDEVLPSVLPPFDQVIQQIGAIAQEPVWFHPGSSPLDFLVEQMAQKAVIALREHDEHRERRLANLAFRFDLMAIDLRQHKQLQPIARFLDVLATYVRAGGGPIPQLDSPLEDPFMSVLSAVAEASAAGMGPGGQENQ